MYKLGKKKMYKLGIIHKIMLQEKKHGTNCVFYMTQIIWSIVVWGEGKKTRCSCTKMLAMVFKQNNEMITSGFLLFLV